MKPAINVAVVGASNDRSKFGNKAVRASVASGFAVHPVHPREVEIEGLPCFASVEQIPADLDRILIYLPPGVLIPLLPAMARKGCAELWLNPGTDAPEVVAEAERLGLNVVRACAILGMGKSPADF